MGLAAEELTVIDQILSASAVDGSVLGDLRRQFPHLSWTKCDASDVAEAPFRTYPGFDLHLLDAADHCVQLTEDPARATGIVLAQRKALP
ncbi:DUF6129 family protein [Azorhizobium sp. AG788]|uniref:DUF6129 family protein n=1 Tax=Azorhizobium sp. AG788 TaxID=2183897 RepID=UPI0031391E42